MPDNPTIKVLGYSQAVTYPDGIRYRNFSDSLVGNQFVDDGGSALFTLGNFSVTTNISPSISINYNTGAYSQFFSLSDINLTEEESELLFEDSNKVRLKLDRYNPKTLAYFGSMTELVRVSLENIITNWPASIYINPTIQTITGGLTQIFSVVNYQYDSLSDTATFDIPYQAITNHYELNIVENQSISDTFNESNDLRDMVTNFSRYVLTYSDIDHAVLDFTGLQQPNTGSITMTVAGDPFGEVNNGLDLYEEFHIRPESVLRDMFFNSLNDLESNLLNTLIKPKYTSTFKYKIENDEGVVFTKVETITWPTSDGYNIDFNTPQYEDYVERLRSISDETDLTDSDIIVRQLVSESISSFDTAPITYITEDELIGGQKVNKLLRIYGRNFDDIKRYIDSISLANVVTHDGNDNTPDIALKNLAYVLGWDPITSIVGNDLLENYMERPRNQFSGHSRNYTTIEAEYELWRRLILNSRWIWESKGHRKVIEFLLRFIGSPEGLITFAEHVYVADKVLDVDLIQQVITANLLNSDISDIVIDNEGFPKPLPNNSSMWFQKGGGWYRETGGVDASIHTNKGNNPHIGPYDGGKAYMDQFRAVIPEFTPTALLNTVIQTGTTALFTNYNLGTVNNYTGGTFVDVTSDEFFLDDCVLVTSTVVDDPKPQDELTECGCDSILDDGAIEISVNFSAATAVDCSEVVYNGTYSLVSDGSDFFVYQYPQYNDDGTPYNPPSYSNPFIHPQCCETLSGGYPIRYVDFTWYDSNGQTVSGTTDMFGSESFNEGYICCQINGSVSDSCVYFATCNWRLNGTIPNLYEVPTQTQGTIDIDGERYLLFLDPNNNNRVVSPNGINCVTPTVATEVVDPFTNETGFGCRLVTNPVSTLGWMLLSNTYMSRFKGDIGCSDVITGEANGEFQTG